MLIQDTLPRSAERESGKTMLVCGGRRLPSADVNSRANRFANAAIVNGIRRGDTVASVAAHWREHLEDFIAPRYVEFVQDLPVTRSGKAAKRGLA